jgi:hypothetical protein
MYRYLNKPVVKPLASVDSLLRSLPAAGRVASNNAMVLIKAIAIGGMSAILTLAPNLASAQGVSKGGVSCGVWLELRRKDNALGPEMWILGFLSAKAHSDRSSVLKGSDPASFEMWMDKHCREDPLSNIARGSAALYDELIRRQTQ